MPLVKTFSLIYIQAEYVYSDEDKMVDNYK